MTSSIEYKAWQQAVLKGERPKAVNVFKHYSADIRQAGQRKFNFTVSTEAVDRDGDTVSAKGWKLDRYKSNPVVLWGHDASQPPVAKSTWIGVEGSRLKAVTEFPPHGVYQFADTVCGLVDAGFLKGTSVGFNPVSFEKNVHRGGVDFYEQELLEYSFVPIPSNPEALQEAKAHALDAGRAEEYLDGLALLVKSFRSDAPEDVITAFDKALRALKGVRTVSVPAIPKMTAAVSLLPSKGKKKDDEEDDDEDDDKGKDCRGKKGAQPVASLSSLGQHRSMEQRNMDGVILVKGGPPPWAKEKPEGEQAPPAEGQAPPDKNAGPPQGDKPSGATPGQPQSQAAPAPAGADVQGVVSKLSSVLGQMDQATLGAAIQVLEQWMGQLGIAPQSEQSAAPPPEGQKPQTPDGQPPAEPGQADQSQQPTPPDQEDPSKKKGILVGGVSVDAAALAESIRLEVQKQRMMLTGQLPGEL